MSIGGIIELSAIVLFTVVLYAIGRMLVFGTPPDGRRSWWDD